MTKIREAYEKQKAQLAEDPTQTMDSLFRTEIDWYESTTLGAFERSADPRRLIQRDIDSVHFYVR